MTIIDIVKIIFAVISFLTIATWYVVCWLYKKNDKFEKSAFVLTLIIAGISIVALVGTSLGV